MGLRVAKPGACCLRASNAFVHFSQFLIGICGHVSPGLCTLKRCAYIIGYKPQSQSENKGKCLPRAERAESALLCANNKQRVAPAEGVPRPIRAVPSPKGEKR